MIDYVEEEIVRHEWTGNVDNITRGQILVRCKDCKHGQYEEWDNGECVDRTVYCDGYGTHRPDFFCADGVKKE